MEIVIVEDEVRIRRGIANFIPKLNPDYKIVGEAQDGFNGMEVISKLNPDLVIMDIKMPKLDGIQMLEQLREYGVKSRVVILSGYSDFEYAQKAIRMGVTEYLLKPIAVEDLEYTLKTIKRDIENEKQLQVKQSSFISPEHLFQTLILGNVDDASESIAYLNERYDICPEKDYAAVIVYLGNDFNIKKNQVKDLMISLMDNKSENYNLIELNAYNELLLLVKCHENMSNLERYFQNIVLKVIRKNIRNVIMGWIQFNGLQNIRCSLKTLRNELKWSIVLGDDVLVSYPKIRTICTKPVQYPVEIERSARIAIYSRNIEKLRVSFRDFLALWRQYPYKPDNVIEIFVRFASSIINVIKETDTVLYNQINLKEILQRVMDSLTWSEISGALQEIVDKIDVYYRADENKIYSLVIKKALYIIEEHYSNGITLDEISAKLCITPEYLSSLFCHEIGENFTAYIRKLRINKSKELLTKTNLKIYEIGDKVGYVDPKYFSRVFKEETDLSPSEYQRSHRV